MLILIIEIPLSWEFHHDLIMIINLDNKKILDSLGRERSKKNIFIKWLNRFG